MVEDHGSIISGASAACRDLKKPSTLLHPRDPPFPRRGDQTHLTGFRRVCQAGPGCVWDHTAPTAHRLLRAGGLGAGVPPSPRSLGHPR